MKVKHKCGKKVVSNEAKKETYTRRSYNEHAAMHYDCGDGWDTWTETSYLVEKCVKCGKSHYLKHHDLLQMLIIAI